VLNVIGGDQLASAYYDALQQTDLADPGPVADALGSERPVIIADAAQDQRWREATLAARAAGVAALWVMPFAEQQRAATGAILLHFTAPRMPDEPELDRLHNVLQLCKLALEEHQTSRQLYVRANYDPVTRLPNRSLLYDRLARALEYAPRHDEQVAVALYDLDEFKMVNDSLGHAIGDELLQNVAARVSDVVRSEDTVARLGGDEFVLVVPVNDADGAALVADKVNKALQRPVWLQGHRLSAAASIGIALYPRDGARTEDLLQAADTAMYAAKWAGRNRYHFYSADLNARVHERMSIESGLRRGLANGELHACYQPIVEAANGRVVAIEALLRWRHPDQGWYMPSYFLAEAEESDLVCDLDRWLLERAATDLQWLAGHGYRFKVSVNVSPRNLQQGDFAGRFLQTLRERGLPPRRCEIEITENLLMPDVVHARNQIHELKRRAPELSLAIDDFGTGYASLNYLRDLPIDGLKIDRTFVADTPARQGRTTRAIARTIAELGHDLDLCVTAEGVENAGQLELTQAIGCDRVQGFYFAYPMVRNELLAYLDRAGETEPKG
jgi:diguanylate cyclase (GGDEF)-like protein